MRLVEVSARVGPHARYDPVLLLVLSEQPLGEVGVLQRLTDLPLGVVVGEWPGGVVEVAAIEGGSGVADGLGQHLEDNVFDVGLRYRRVVGFTWHPRCPLLPLGLLVERLDRRPHGVADEASRVAGEVLLLGHGYAPSISSRVLPRSRNCGAGVMMWAATATLAGVLYHAVSVSGRA